MAKTRTPKAEAQEVNSAQEPQEEKLISFEEPAVQPAEPNALGRVPESEAAPLNSPPVSVSTEPIAIVEQPTPAVVHDFGVSDTPPEGFTAPAEAPAAPREVPFLTEHDLSKLHAEAMREDEKFEFTRKLVEAYKPPPEQVYVQPPIAPRVVAQTNAELEAGRKIVAENEALQSQRVHRPAPPEHSGNTEVFRPANYIPDPKKGQGNVQARTL